MLSQDEKRPSPAAQDERNESPASGEWHLPKPETLPEPTYWPAVLAFGAALSGFGVLTSFIISAVGLALVVLAAAKWVGELCHETG